MTKKNQTYFSLLQKEEEVMSVLWDTDDALSASEIAERIPNRAWPASSIQYILRSLEKKNAVKVHSIAKLGKSYGRLFRPTLSANEYAAMQFQRYYQTSKTDFHSMISSLIGNASANDEEIAASLRALLEKYEKKEE